MSACLLGEKVRFDAGHKKNDFLTEVLSPYVEWVPVCPELEMGLGVPRDPLHLEDREGRTYLIQTKSGRDLSAAMISYAKKRLRELKNQNLSGYVLKKDSPSCGMERVKLYPELRKGPPAKRGRGLFAEALLQAFPGLPVEEEGRLADPALRENFIERLFAYQRLKGLFSSSWKLSELVSFHSRHKLALMSHSPEAYRALGKLVANAKDMPRGALEASYQAQFMEGFGKLATRKKHGNVLLHLLGFFKKSLGAEERGELLSVIEDYQKAWVPLIVPITLIQYFAKSLKVEYLLDQTYLNPHPKELMLRNHI